MTEDTSQEDTTVDMVEASEPQPKKPRKPRAPRTKKLKLDSSTSNAVAAVNEPVAEFYVATSMTRPLNPVINSVVYETDTGHRVQFNGSGWDFVDALH